MSARQHPRPFNDPMPTLEEAERRRAARNAGLPLTATWREIHEKLGKASPAVVVDQARQEERDERELEWQTQQKVVELFRAWGGRVWVRSEPRRQKLTPGAPDLVVFFPARSVAVDWETKRPVGGKYSPAQMDYRAMCEACNRLWGGGDKLDAEQWLIDQGWAERGPTGVLEPIRQSRA